MMLAALLSIGLSLPAITWADYYAVPSVPPSTAGKLDPSPVGVSIEFFAFPSYFTNVSNTVQCLQNLQSLTGTWPPIRIGGATQDRAQYDPGTPAYVVYTVASPRDAPSYLTYGSSFMTLANSYKGTIVMGLNRELNNITNTVAAAKVATSKIANLEAIELGNEPIYWSNWNETSDYQQENNWDILLGESVDETNIIQAGVYDNPTWKIGPLIATENETVLSYVKGYSHHNYPGGTVSSLMNHVDVRKNVNQFSSDVSAANAVDKYYVFGETNSVAGGGSAAVSPTFGAGLWVMDYSLHAASVNIQRLYFHHGTVGKCNYCWWGELSMFNSYYGAYVATAAMAGGAKIVEIDNLATNYSAYVIYNSTKAPIRVALYNSNYFNGTGLRGSEPFTLTGLSVSTVTAKRLTASNALSRVDQGSSATFGGQSFIQSTCEITGTELIESYPVLGGNVTVTLNDSEGLLVYL